MAVFQKSSSKYPYVRCRHFFEKPAIFDGCSILNENDYNESFRLYEH